MSSHGCLRAFAGWLVACGATAAIVSLPLVFIVATSARSWMDFLQGLAAILATTLLVFVEIGVITAFPAILMIWLSVKLRTRSVGFFACSGAMVGASGVTLLARSVQIWTSGAVTPFIVAGIVAGVAYWFVAGRHAICASTA